MPGKLKPKRWNLRPHLTTAPDLWRGCVGAWPFWEGSGNLIADTSPNGSDATIENYVASQWSSVSWGVSYTVLSSGEKISAPSINFGGNDPISVHWMGQSRDTGGDSWLVSQSTEIVLRQISGGGIEFILNSFSSNDRVSISNIFSTFETIYATGTYDGKTLSVFLTVNDVTHSASVVPIGSYSKTADPLEITGGLSQRSMRNCYVEVSARACSLAEHTKRAADPFKMLRPRGF